jgi:alanine racemase
MNRLGLTADQLPAARRELAAMASGTRPADADDALCRSRRRRRRALHRLAARTLCAMTADWPAAASLAGLDGQLGGHPALPADRARLGAAGDHALWRQPVCRPGCREPVTSTGDDPAQPHPRGAGNRASASASVTAAPLSRRRPTRVGVVACGYADGYPAARAGRYADRRRRPAHADPRSGVDGHAGLRSDRSARTAGVGSPVVLWGEGLPADEVATAAGTISYELFCALARRVPVVEV